MGQTEEIAFMRAQFAALKIAVRAEREARQASSQAARAEIDAARG